MLEGQFVFMGFGKDGHACTSICIIIALQAYLEVLLLIDQTCGYLADI